MNQSGVVSALGCCLLLPCKVLFFCLLLSSCKGLSSMELISALWSMGYGNVWGRIPISMQASWLKYILSLLGIYSFWIVHLSLILNLARMLPEQVSNHKSNILFLYSAFTSWKQCPMNAADNIKIKQKNTFFTKKYIAFYIKLSL